MDSEIKTVVTFESTAFNMAETTDEKPGQEDFGWYLNFEVSGTAHTLVIGHRPTGETEAGTWIGWIERRRGFLPSLVGARDRGIQPAAVEAIDKVLSNSSLIRDVRWQSRTDLDKG
jgi:hypothetical protein